MPEGMKFDSEKPRAGLVLGGFAEALLEVSKVGTFGAKKYAPNNWKLVDSERYVDALFRHLMQWRGDEPIDSETGLSHLAHAAWNILAILQLTSKDSKDVKQLKLPLDYEERKIPVKTGTRLSFGVREEDDYDP